MGPEGNFSPSPASEASEGPIAGGDARIKKKPGRHQDFISAQGRIRGLSWLALGNGIFRYASC